jgi:P4 family phage/plasmid primase-like protien
MTQPSNNVVQFRRQETIPDNAIAIANMLVEQEMMTTDGLLTAAMHGDKIVLWNGSKYVHKEKHYIQNRLINLTDGKWTQRGSKEVPFDLGSGRLSVAIKAVEKRISEGLDHTKPLPQWRSLDWQNSAYSSPFDDAYILPFANGIVHLLTGKQAPCTPAYVNLNCADYVYDPNAGAEEWLRDLSVWFGKDQAAIDTLQEAFGLSLVPDFKHEKMLCLIGPSGIGKRLIAMVLTHLTGSENVASATIQSVGGNFGFENWEEKSIAIFRDARISSGKIIDIQSVISMLLSIVSHEPVPLNRKHKKIIEALFDTHVWYFSNEVPFFADYHLAMARRYLIIVMRNWLKDGNAPALDLDLLPKLLKELPGILNWALVGLKRLRERGNFIQPESGIKVLNEIRYKSCPEQEFIDYYIRYDRSKFTEMEMLRSQYRIWCNRTEHEYKDMNILSRRIQQDHPEVEVVKGGGNYVIGYRGFELVNLYLPRDADTSLL